MDRLRDYLSSNRVDAELIDMGKPMTTAGAAADLLGVPIGRIFKSLVLLDTDNRALLVVLPGDVRLDQNALARLAGARKLRFAPEDVVLKVTGYPAGGTPPLGHFPPLPVYVDENVLTCESGYGGGGHPAWLLRIRPEELVRVTAATVARLGRH